MLCIYTQFVWIIMLDTLVLPSIQFSFFFGCFLSIFDTHNILYRVLIPVQNGAKTITVYIMYAEIDQQTHEMNFRECGNWFSVICFFFLFFLVICICLCSILGRLTYIEENIILDKWGGIAQLWVWFSRGECFSCRNLLCDSICIACDRLYIIRLYQYIYGW